MRDHLVLYVNGVRQVVRGRDAFLSLSDFLRLRLGLIGTKIVCSEGDCGACTVLIGRPTSKHDGASSPPPLKGREQPSTVAGGDRAQGGSPREATWGGIGDSNGASAARTSAALKNPSPNLSPQGRGITYRPIDSCIQFLFQLDGTHIVTVEGLRPDGRLNAVQQAMVDCHGSQCGFCTPGFVMAMAGLLEGSQDLDEPQLRTGLTGNLCRCTGYTPIIEAGLKSCEGEQDRLNDLYPSRPVLAEFENLHGTPITLQAEWFGQPHVAACPTTLEGALEFLAAHPTATIVAGATDIGVRINKTHKIPPAILDLNRIAELDYVRTEDGVLRAGARASWTAILEAVSACDPPPSKGGARGGIHDRDRFDQSDVLQTPLTRPLPSGERGLSEFANILSLFGAPQIRHVGTIGGNIANASPIADSLPFLYVMEAKLVLASAARPGESPVATGRREVNINDFYRGYKQLDLRPGELIAEVRIPLPAPDDILRLYKVSRRRDLDIAGFTAAIRLRLSDDVTIAAASIALGAVAPTVLRARRTEQFLIGQPFTEETLQAAGDLAVRETTPINDVRGSANYRRQLTRNIFLKFYHQHEAQPV